MNKMIYDCLVNSLGRQQQIWVYTQTRVRYAQSQTKLCVLHLDVHILLTFLNETCLNNTSLPFRVLEFESKSIIPVTEGEMSSGTFFVAMTLLMEHIRCECVLLPDC